MVIIDPAISERKLDDNEIREDLIFLPENKEVLLDAMLFGARETENRDAAKNHSDKFISFLLILIILGCLLLFIFVLCIPLLPI